MQYGAGTGAAAAAAAAIANAIKASGAIVSVEATDFMKIINRADKPLVVTAEGGIFKKHYRYISSYKGLAFFTKSEKSLMLGSRIEIVAADKIWIPG
jgi:hypothetical protein